MFDTLRKKVLIMLSLNRYVRRRENERKKWKQPALKASNGILYKYARQVKPASEGCVTDES